MVKLHKLMLYLLVLTIYLLPTVKAIAVGPTKIDITVDKGVEDTIVRNIQLMNAEAQPIHISGSVVGPISEFITLEPSEFDLPAGPGVNVDAPAPYTYVKATIRIPRELPKNQYTGEILFTQKPIGGGNLAASASIGVRVTLNIGKIAEAVFPMYINVMIFLLVIILLVSIITTYRKRKRKRK